jgi:hypothetical protein
MNRIPPPPACLPPWIGSPPAVITANQGTQQYGEYLVSNGLFNPGTGSAQTITVTSQANWYAVSTQPASPPQVRSYPAVAYSCGWPVSSYKSIVSSFAETWPAGAIGEAAYDIFTAGTSTAPTARTTEVMIWTDTHGATPAGSVIATPTINGVTYNLYFSSTLQTWPYYAFEAQSNFSSGTVDILAILNYLVANGYILASDIINTIFFGWEIITAAAAVFQMTSYSVSVSGGAGGPQW